MVQILNLNIAPYFWNQTFGPISCLQELDHMTIEIVPVKEWSIDEQVACLQVICNLLAVEAHVLNQAMLWRAS